MSERRNPEALHEAAAGWREMGKHLDGLVRELDRHVGAAAAANWHGPAGEAFAAEWHRLKRSVDDSLPVFELAAADLETAAAKPDDNGDGQEHGAPPVQNQGGSGQSSSGSEMAYGFMALGQLANGLGGAFGKRGGQGGGRGQGPLVRHQWDTSTAAQGPDPFGPAEAREGRPRGGEGLAKGVRTQPASPQPAPGDERDPKATAAKPANSGSAGKPGGGEATASAGKAGSAEKAGTATKPSRGADAAKPEEDAGPAGPNPGRHGAFG
ncbi:WXG100 family type VII secretion target [Streptomyces sp. NPDC020742]|uniref:WXG100 family type VII secretion target n=1 Tax=Streptomyces sp. NPDC020742 TaxID=3154897 RepID=UPI0033E2DB16